MAALANYDTLVARARTHVMTSSERRQQRVSLVMGLRGNESTLTREKVEEVLDTVEGCADEVISPATVSPN